MRSRTDSLQGTLGVMEELWQYRPWLSIRFELREFLGSCPCAEHEVDLLSPVGVGSVGSRYVGVTVDQISILQVFPARRREVHETFVQIDSIPR